MLNPLINHCLSVGVQPIKDQLQTTLTAQQKKGAVIALAVFSAFAACYALYRSCFQSSAPNSRIVIPQPKVSNDLLRDAYKYFGSNLVSKKYVSTASKTGLFFDPELYLKRWNAQSLAMGGSPGDQVREYFEKKMQLIQDPAIKDPGVQSDPQKIRDQTDVLHRKIQDHFKGEDRMFSYPESCRNFALKVLDTGILVDPRGYLELWEEERGGSEEFRVVEDEVRHFFENELI